MAGELVQNAFITLMRFHHPLPQFALKYLGAKSRGSGPKELSLFVSCYYCSSCTFPVIHKPPDTLYPYFAYKNEKL